MNICTYDDTLIYSGSKDPFLSSKNNITIFRFRIDFACNNSIAMVILSMKKVLVLKGSEKVVVKTVSTIAQVNSIVERFKNKEYTVKVYSV